VLGLGLGAAAFALTMAVVLRPRRTHRRDR